eukprot:COSAG02_NODE_60066_length_272_cov_0.855491_1_plen_44_part_10
MHVESVRVLAYASSQSCQELFFAPSQAQVRAQAQARAPARAQAR